MKRILHGLLLLAIAALSALTAVFLPGAINGPTTRPLIEGATSDQAIIDGLKQLSAAEIDTLLAREEAAFMADPLNVAPLKNILALTGLKGDNQKTEAIAIAMADFNRRSLSSQLIALQIEAERGDFDKAFDRIDGVLRAKPEQAERLFPLVRAMSEREGANTALSTILGREPPWRWNYFSFLLKGDDVGAAAYGLSKAMRKANVSLTDTEKRALLDRMFSAGRIDAAYFVWLDLLPQSDLARVRSVFDGGFDTVSKYMFFDWNLAERQNARISISSRPGKSQDRVLLIDMLDDGEGKQFVHQYTRLPPGPQVMSYEVQVENIKADKGLIWRIGCVEQENVLAESTPIKDKGPWRTDAFSFTVPEQGCTTQYLRLVNQGTVALDMKITGRVMIDNVRIDAAGATGDAEAPAEGQQ